MDRKHFSRYTMFGLLYFTQGTILSFFTALNALYLLGNGVDMTRIGILGTIALLPFVLKVFLGMLSDKENTETSTDQAINKHYWDWISPTELDL